MPTYVSLITWTDQGVRSFQDTVARAEAGRELAAKFGGTLKEIYWTLGPYDIVAVSEAPDDETATAFALALSAQGNVRTATMRAFGPEEMRGILEKARAGAQA
ncbi:MAG TPA: GYD domain-containing protein [Gaiellaceae bacterium]|nr:GYD domain-containing protein [Gaiellaceae bacterium]